MKSYIRVRDLLAKKRLRTINPSVKLTKKEIETEGKTPVVSQDDTYYMGYTDIDDKKLLDPPYIIFGDHTECIKFIKTAFVQGADGIKIIKVNKNENPSFYYYALRCYYNKTGNYERHFKLLRRTFLPDIDVSKQRKIASILSAYDNLIENNNRRIRLLEQMAENLYKEWFVRFRFPGHEKAEFENGLPKGWVIKKLYNLLEVKYGKDHSKIGDGNIPIFGSGGVMRYGCKKIYSSESILIPRKGSLNNIMYIDEPFWTVDTMFYTEMKYKHIAKYLYCVLSGIDMESFNSGAALPSMTTNILNHFKVICPSDDILEPFDNKIGNIYKSRKLFQQQSELLARQRDLLLPRLMSGKLEV